MTYNSLLEDDIVYCVNTNTDENICGKALLDNYDYLNEFIKQKKRDASIKTIVKYVSFDGKREFTNVDDATKYEIICNTCDEILKIEDKRAALVKLIRYCGKVLSAHINGDFTDIFNPTADLVEKNEPCAFRCQAWRILSDFKDTYPCLYSTYYTLGQEILDE